MEPHVITLRDGRNLAYAEYGKADGASVFFFHGTPGSHWLSDIEITLVERLGLRYIVPVRPGYGLSDLQSQSTLLDWPDDVLALADVLEIAHFGVMGVSGGGPYAAACALKIPERLTKVALVSSLGPFEFLGGKPQPMTRERREFKARQLEAEPDQYFDTVISNIGEADRDPLIQLKSWFIANMREAYRQGVGGAVHEETLLLTQSWGFPVEAIKANMYLWQGEADQNVPVNHGRYLAEHIPNCVATFVPDVGHLMPEFVLEDIYRIFIAADTP